MPPVLRPMPPRWCLRGRPHPVCPPSRAIPSSWAGARALRRQTFSCSVPPRPTGRSPIFLSPPISRHRYRAHRRFQLLRDLFARAEQRSAFAGAALLSRVTASCGLISRFVGAEHRTPAATGATAPASPTPRKPPRPSTFRSPATRPLTQTARHRRHAGHRRFDRWREPHRRQRRRAHARPGIHPAIVHQQG